MKDFDFGFTTISEGDIALDHNQLDTLTQQLKEEKERSKKLFDSVQPLLQNLGKSDGKEYIHWPDRVGKVEKFANKLKSIYLDGT